MSDVFGPSSVVVGSAAPLTGMPVPRPGLAGFQVTEGPVPDHLDGAVHVGPLDAAAPGRYLLRLPTVGRFLVEVGEGGGVRVAVQRAAGASDADVACLLGGPVRQACWLLRGRFALRGCGVVIGGRAVAVTGGPATGKSAVTAALAQRGHRLLADGALPVRPDGPVAETADAAVQLWPDVVDQLGLDPQAGRLVRPGLAKRLFRWASAPATPLAAVVVLHRVAGVGDVRAEPVRGLAAVEPLAAYTAMHPLVAPFGAAADHFAWYTRLAAAVRVVHLRTDGYRRDLPAVADAVEAQAGLAPAGIAVAAGLR